ncbi:pentapeptide repeat-containing protein [Streptomyces sp. V1I1]|uniref:pentapeptide repeat-containing protein n=1 Tax=Streptomyces sp. V1I1 TaxID=3042272 RepID=UPI002785775B|nr:pentapeptide repeat-containing protein [Streptomyces sp. V1I1]MDQ0945934.1 hypothetical protein [Streptomyces sp. V1I1]
MTPPTLPSSAAPPWPHCARDANPDNPIGCRGRTVDGYHACLAHLTPADRATYLSHLTAGSDIDHRGTAFSRDLLRGLLNALRDPATERPHLGTALFKGAAFTADAPFEEVTFTSTAQFENATFADHARFRRAMFTGSAWFEKASFSGDAQFEEVTFVETAQFESATFAGHARFRGATFTGDAWFEKAQFAGHAQFRMATFTCSTQFDEATFTGGAWFEEARFASHAQFEGVLFARHARFWGATFTADARFQLARFSGDAQFERARFSGDAHFEGVTFETATELGPLTCAGDVDLSEAVFACPVTIRAASSGLKCRRTRWASTAALRLRYATVDVSDAVFEYPLSITAQTTPFTDRAGDVVAETELEGRRPGVRMASLRGADAAHLVLHNIALTSCLLSGTLHLDQLRLEGECSLPIPPTGLRRRGLLPVRWTARRTLSEEHHWRASQGWKGWTPPPVRGEVVGPAGLAPVYRQLRKSFEDSKNEPDAADFYYGEMEMRRHDRQHPSAERALLALYWAVSGYGLRASRALGWLLGAMAVTVLVMMLWGLPKDDPRLATTGRLAGQDILLTTDKPEPVNPSGPLRPRLTSERWEKSLRIVVNSVVFRSSGHDLTTTGTYTEMASRLAEPVLLALAALAIRGRVKR